MRSAVSSGVNADVSTHSPRSIGVVAVGIVRGRCVIAAVCVPARRSPAFLVPPCHHLDRRSQHHKVDRSRLNDTQLLAHIGAVDVVLNDCCEAGGGDVIGHQRRKAVSEVEQPDAPCQRLGQAPNEFRCWRRELTDLKLPTSGTGAASRARRQRAVDPVRRMGDSLRSPLRQG